MAQLRSPGGSTALASWRFAALSLLALLLAACSRGPDAQRLQQDVQARVDGLFGRQVLALESLKRQGSAPYLAADDGASQVVVYYNAVFRVAETYDPSDWQGLSPTMIANALGAADEGVSGLRSGPNEPGSELRVYGSILYRESGEEWQPADVVAPRPAAPATASAGAQESRADELVRRLAELVRSTPAPRNRNDEIIAEELGRALENIRLRTQGNAEAMLVAAGPEGGEYWRFLSSLVAQFHGRGPVQVAASAGSVENALMIDRGEAKLGLVQSDVAAAAVSGEGVFSGTGPLAHLRAVASLFPEPLHIVVRAESDVASVADLVGRRVVLGTVASGTRQTALGVLATAGIDIKRIAVVEARTPEAALGLLADGGIDAVIEVVSAPWRQLEIAMHAAPLRLVALDLGTRVELGAAARGLLPLSIPARTYPGQDGAVATVAATALLVTRDDVPDDAVRNTLDLRYASAASGGAGVLATRLSKSRALDGVTIPVHPAAARYLGPADQDAAFKEQRSGSAERETKMAALEDFARRYTAAWCGHDAGGVAAFFDVAGSLTINDGTPSFGRTAIAAAAQSFMTDFPDLVVEFDRLEARGDRVLYHWTLSGTNTGPGGTGNSVRISGYEDWKLGPGSLIAESQGHYDARDYERQVRVR
jgi:TRAP transporter TAXI family solute receptor